MLKKLGFIGLIIIVALIATGYGSATVAEAPESVAPTSIAMAESTKSGQSASAYTSDTPCSPDYDPFGPNFPDFPDKFSAEIPGDAYDSPMCPGLKPPSDPILRIKLQRLYDLFSWQSFLAINWPVDDKETPRKKFSDDGAPQWTTWKESYEVFKADGSEPSEWGHPRTLPTPPDCCPLETIPDPLDKNTRILFEVNQANSNLPLWDQNSNEIYYEILVNEDEFRYIRRHKLFNLQGQIEFFKDNQSVRQEVVSFAVGNLDGTVGAIELKLAWKIIDGQDIPGRFYTMDAYIPDEINNTWVQKTVGLVGMHIAHKTLSSNQWAWSTFEHVDNVRVNDLDVLKYEEEGQILRPSFNDPNCPTCPVNVKPEPDSHGTRKTQVMRVIPIPKATEDLNRQVQKLLRAENSKWQYYELISTQYATDPVADPVPSYYGLPESITNRSGGKPAPVYLVNSVIETYDQEGNQEASNLIQGLLNDSKQKVFGTQSCMGCHFSAGIAVRQVSDKEGNKKAVYEPGTADFSWLLQRAR